MVYFYPGIYPRECFKYMSFYIVKNLTELHSYV